LEVADEIRSFADDEVVAMLESLAQRCDAGFWRLLAESVESGDLFLEAALARHRREV
jgi:hypothetical protein